MIDSIEAATGRGIERIFDYGVGMTVMVLALICAGYLVKLLLSRCDQRFQESLDMHRVLVSDVKNVVEKNTAAFYDLREQIRNKD